MDLFSFIRAAKGYSHEVKHQRCADVFEQGYLAAKTKSAKNLEGMVMATPVFFTQNRYEQGAQKVFIVNYKHDAQVVAYATTNRYEQGVIIGFVTQNKYEQGVIKVFLTNNKFET